VSFEHALLRACGVRHGFGERGDAPLAALVRPRQVHGTRVATVAECIAGVDADAVVASEGSPPVGVVTADCVPVLAASADGRAVAAIHAGWRGLAAGVVEAGIEALRREAPHRALSAVIGPNIGPCCYEVDTPVLDALRHFDAELDAACTATRPGHCRLDLAALARAALLRAGVSPEHVGVPSGACTSCDPRRFHSYRRDGPRAGRLVHWIGARILDSAEGGA
jgi:purine-nucleoside/S-methyl-5'-thioadenosine phosphorylase / adenosine deaminase